LRWYEFTENATVLEVGAGCGGITEELVRNNVKVTALELAEKRALINVYRNQTADNLEVFIGNLEDFISNKKFDYVICVGVLEYAGTFIHSASPYEDFMNSISALLAPGGKFLLAIENRLGLKYWAGAKEDHVHTFFEGHNGYPSPKQIQTFGRKELADLFLRTGFTATDFYYPFPDYKNPSLVYSDSFYPGKGTTFPLGMLPTPTLDRPRENFFSEQCVMRYIEANNLFPDFSNSFLVEGTK
jgi:SAM-dependent methyltransferase